MAKFTHQCPTAVAVNILRSFSVHPPSAIDKVTEDINECFLNNFLPTQHRLGIPAKWWERLLCLLELSVDFGGI